MTTRPTRQRDEIVVSASIVRRLLLLLVIVVAVAALVTQRDRIASVGAPAGSRYVDVTTYQAVFLSSSQVYFGRLQIDGQAYVLTDVYYLNAPQDSATSLGQLVKRGSELHGPADPLVLPEHSVLFFENMRSDSQVMNGIRQIKAGNTTPLATPARSVAPSPSATR